MAITINTPQVVINVTADFGPILERLNAMDQRIQDGLDDLGAKVEQDTSVTQSAVTLLNGFGAQLQAAIDAAKNAGASDDQVQAFTDLRTAIQTNTQALADAVAANTAQPTGESAAMRGAPKR